MEGLKMKKVFLISFAVLLSFVGFVGNSVSAEASKAEDINLTFDEYMDWLENYDLEQALASGVTPDSEEELKAGAQAIIKAAKALSKEDRVEFMENVNNPMLKLEKAFSENNLVLEKESEFNGIGVRNSGYVNKSASYTGVVKEVGNDMAKVRVSGTYEVYGTTVVRALTSTAQVVANYYPYYTYSTPSISRGKTGQNHFRADATWNVTRLNSAAGKMSAWVEGNYVGTTTGGVKKH